MIVLLLLLAQQPDSPANHQIHFAVSEDGLAWTEAEAPVRKKASVPDLVLLEGGKLAVYACSFASYRQPGDEGIVRIVSEDGGKTWSEGETIKIEGKTNKGGAVDPSAVRLDDGRIRLYYFGSEVTRGDPAGAEGDHCIYSAVSDDGVTFTVEEGVRFAEERITDPEVIRAGDAWLMLLSRGPEVLLARSADGLAFEKVEGFRLDGGGVPGGAALDDGRVRIYQSSRDGITSAVYDPESGRVEKDAGARVKRGDWGMVADPDVVRLEDGTFAMILKRAPKRR